MNEKYNPFKLAIPFSMRIKTIKEGGAIAYSNHAANCMAAHAGRLIPFKKNTDGHNHPTIGSESPILPKGIQS